MDWKEQAMELAVALRQLVDAVNYECEVGVTYHEALRALDRFEAAVKVMGGETLGQTSHSQASLGQGQGF